MGIFDGVVGSVVGGVFDLAGSMLQNTANKKAATKAYQRQVEMWNMQNEYNSPAAQVQRLKDAGLNPALVYGTGSAVATGNNKGFSAAPQAAPMSKPKILDVLSAMSLGQDIKKKEAEIANINASTKRAEAETFGQNWSNMFDVIHNESPRKRGLVSRLADYLAGYQGDSLTYRRMLLDEQQWYRDMKEEDKRLIDDILTPKNKRYPIPVISR